MVIMAKKDKAPKEEPVEETKAGKPGKKDKGEKKSKKDSTPDVIEDGLLDPASGGGGWNAKEALGDLLLIRPTKLERDFKTSAGISDVIRAEVVVIDEKKPKKSEAHSDVLLFWTSVVNSLEPAVGKGRVVGRLVMGEASPGKSAPYLLEKATDEEKALAMEYLNSTR